MTARHPRELSFPGRRTAGESFAVDTATAQIVRDPARRNAFVLLLDGVESSHVDLDDATYLAFEYVRWLADVVDLIAPAGAPLATVHLGGGAATLARYIAATRPTSRQVVFEVDAALIDLVRARLPLPKSRRLRMRACDARRGLLSLASGRTDVVVRDAFLDAVVPDHLRTVEFCLLVKEILAPGGTYLLNVADRAPLRLLGVDLAALVEVFEHVAVVCEPAVVRGRRQGNFVVAASDSPLPVDAIARRVAVGAVAGRVRAGGEARAMARGHRPLHDPPGMTFEPRFS